MISSDFDLIIVGGGIPGLTLACGLQESGLKVAVVEAQSQEQVRNFSRAYALSPLSTKIFKGLGIWQQIAAAITHFPKVVLSDADSPHRVVFTPEELGETAVYYCAEHQVLQTALQQKLAATPGFDCFYEMRVVDVVYGASRVEVKVDQNGQQRVLSAALVVAADGQESLLRRQAGIGVDRWDYWQSCVTAFITPTQSHQNIAYERFWPAGPFAILPLPRNRCQIVWVLPHQEAERVASLAPEQFIAEMQPYYGDHSGSVQLLGKPRLFPARFMHSRVYCKHRLAMIGDAAHHCHPVGGQGLNLGIRDAITLAHVLITARQQQQDWGEVKVLLRYGRRRRLENWVMLLFTDVLNRTFSNHWWPLVVVRRLVLRWMAHWLPLRYLILRLMTGFWQRAGIPMLMTN